MPRSASDQREQLLRRLSANDSSIDLMSLDPVFVAEFAQAGFLDEIPRSEERLFTEGIFDAAVDSATWQGRLAAAPFWANTQVLWYRKSVAQKAGLDLESSPVTWQQIIDAARATDKTVGVQAQRYEGYTVLINALIEGAGGHIIKRHADDADKIQLGLVSTPGKQAAEIIRNIAHGGVGGSSLSTADEEAARDMFQGPDGAFMVNWPYVWRAANAAVEEGSVSQDVVDDIGWARYPRSGSDHPSRPPLGGIDIGIGHWSKHPGLALEATRCITSTENQTDYFLTNGNPAARASVFSDPRIRKEFPMAALLRQSLEASAPRPKTQFYGDLSSALQIRWHPPGRVTSATPASVR